MQRPGGVGFAAVRLETGVRLHYAEGGDRVGEAIVFLHAFADSWFWFSRVLPLLSPEYRVLVPDQRGHGKSDKPDCCYATEDFAADVVAFMDAVGVDSATLVGHSSGGLIAQRVVLRYPRRVRRLVLIGAPTTLANNPAVREVEGEMIALRDPISPEFVRTFLEGTIHTPVPRQFLETAVMESLQTPARVWRDYWEGVLLTTDDTGRLGEILAPTMILWGEQDTLLPRAEQELRATEIQDATLVVYPDTGHAVAAERPEWVARDLESFMKGNRPVRP